MPNLTSEHFGAAFELWLQTGWNAGYQIDYDQFVKSWSGSPVKKCAFRDGALVAIGRANSDGVLYSMIHDVVVHEKYRGTGLGRTIVSELVSELQRMGIVVIQLMAAANQTTFYERLGFEARPADAPGMQYVRKTVS